jgi:hypothetical protein
MLSEYSLRNLRQVADDPDIGQSVRRLILVPHHLSQDHLNHLADLKIVDARCCSQRYAQLLAEQEALLDSGWFSCLARALLQAGNCRTIVVVSDAAQKAFGEAWLMRELGAFPTGWVPVPGPSKTEFPSRMIKVILAAVARSGAHLERLELDLCDPYLPTEPSDLRLISSVVNGTRFSSLLRNLYLRLAPPTEPDPCDPNDPWADNDPETFVPIYPNPTWVDDLGAFIGSFGNLEELGLVFDPTLHPYHLMKLVRSQRLQKLRILHVSGAAGDQNDGKELIQAIASYWGTSLKEVTLDSVDLPDLESWKMLAEERRRSLPSTSLTLADCTVSLALVVDAGWVPGSPGTPHTITLGIGSDPDLSTGNTR